MVKDHGPFIAADKRDFVFSKFTGLEKAPEGSGISLYLVKKFIGNTGGKIELNSRLGSGSKIVVYLKDQ